MASNNLGVDFDRALVPPHIKDLAVKIKEDLHKHNPGWSKSWLLEKSTEFNKSYKSMEQLLANQPWELCKGFIYAAAEELK